jgi:hypothetical protein
VADENLKNEKEAIEYWNKRFKKDDCVGWGSHPKDQWYRAKKEAVQKVIRENPDVKTVLDICCGDMKFMMEIPELKNNTVKYTGIEPAKSIYDKITKEYPDKEILNISPSELIKTTMNRDVDMIIAYDFLFHIIEDELYENFLKWVFHRNVKFVVISYDDVQSKEQRSENGHYVPRNFKEYCKSLTYGFLPIQEVKSTRKSSLKLNVFKTKNQTDR